MKKLKDRRLEHIYNVIKPRDTDQFIRYCYLNLHGDISDKEFDDYISHVRREVFENGYTEDDLEKIIKDGKEIASNLEGLTINFN